MFESELAGISEERLKYIHSFLDFVNLEADGLISFDNIQCIEEFEVIIIIFLDFVNCESKGLVSCDNA